MKGLIKHSLVLAAVLLTGCVSYSQHELPAVQPWPPTANAPAQKPTAYVHTTAQNHVNGGPGNAAVGAPVVLWEKAVADSFRQSNRFSRVSTDKVDSDIYVDATLHNNEQFSMASAIITGATFYRLFAARRARVRTFSAGRAASCVGRAEKSSPRTFGPLRRGRRSSGRTLRTPA